MNEIGEKPKTTNNVINHDPNILTSRSITANPIQQQQIHLDQQNNLLQALEALRSSTEIQQIQSEELVNDLKRANSALIKAFNKVKHKYTTRIKKLENQLHSIQTIPSIDSNSLPLNKPFRPQTNSSTIIQTTTTTTTTTTSTTHNNHLSNTFKGCIIEHHDLNNVSINSHIHSIYPIKSSFQQPTIITTTTLNHSLNIPTMIDSNRDFIPSIPTSYIPSIPLHPHHYHLDHHQDHLYPQIQQQPQQQLMKSNTSKLKTTASQHLTNVKQFLTH
ncbi:hypothetical protein Smp_160390 [Schistosoma mansoni]|uniref:hypothetical protein n=1 Tax=Schistosoma mansoni TaxID=6183 RepID=UPI00022C86D0|nr:hypothetical protein Smp_160390 [Schistosoma mansoni]|eukprot:XP_018645478.1 hypothetical protein Smp_160390 [Schistosoma mansoni]